MWRGVARRAWCRFAVRAQAGVFRGAPHDEGDGGDNGEDEKGLDQVAISPTQRVDDEGHRKGGDQPAKRDAAGADGERPASTPDKPLVDGGVYDKRAEQRPTDEAGTEVECPEEPQVGLPAQTPETDCRDEGTSENRQSRTALVYDAADYYTGEGAGKYAERRTQCKLPDLPAQLLDDRAQKYANGGLAYTKKDELKEDCGGDNPPAIEEAGSQPTIRAGAKVFWKLRRLLCTVS